MTTLTSQPDGTTGLDTGIDAANSTPQGSNASIYIGAAGAEVMRGLIHFSELDAVPDSDTVNSATLSIYMDEEDASNSNVLKVYRLKQPWVEATANWTIRDTGINWQTGGASGANDCEATEIGSLNLSSTEAVGMKNISLAGATVGDLDLGYGWLLKLVTEGSDYYEFRMSDYVTAAQRPKLVVDHSSGGGAGTSGSSINKRTLLGVGI